MQESFDRFFGILPIGSRLDHVFVPEQAIRCGKPEPTKGGSPGPWMSFRGFLGVQLRGGSLAFWDPPLAPKSPQIGCLTPASCARWLDNGHLWLPCGPLGLTHVDPFLSSRLEPDSQLRL